MIEFYMNMAKECATMSRAVRLQVGAVIVKNNNILSFSWNGTPAGWDNCCESREWMTDAGGWLDPEEIEERWPYVEYSDYDDSIIGRYRLKTKPEVLHAERNALDKLAKSNESGEGATLFVTHAPCLECAKSIYSVGIKEVFYLNDYRSTEGVEFLRKCQIEVMKMGELLSH